MALSIHQIIHLLCLLARLKHQRDLFKPHDAVWGTDVSKDHELWSDAKKVVLSLFTQLGVGKLQLHVSTIAFTLTAVKGINKEFTALRMMELQERTVLDQLAAAAGGICAIVGSSYCMYIPENDGDEGIITQAIQNLTQLRDAMDTDFKPQRALLDWLMSGTWYQVSMKVIVPVLAILLLFCIFVTCFPPCLRAVIHQMICGSLGEALMTGVEKVYIQL